MVGSQGSVTGIDMTPEMIEKARGEPRRSARQRRLRRGEVEELPFDDGSFDVVISNGVIDLIPDKEAVFASIYRVLAARWPHPVRRRDDPAAGFRGGEAEDRSLDWLNCRRSAGCRVRSFAGAARVRADRARQPRRDLHALEVRGHAAEGDEVRRKRRHREGVQAGLPMSCCSGKGCDEFFSDRVARRNADNYRRKGLDKHARRLVDAVCRNGIEGRTVLEVGGGIGAIQLELLQAGAARSENIELSPAYEPYAAELVQTAGFDGRVERRLMDFAVPRKS